MKIKIYIIIIIVICIKTLYAQKDTESVNKKADIPKNIPQKEKICFFHFQDKSTIDKYNYLSYIIPNAIRADLRNIGNYEIIILPVKMNFLEKNASAGDRVKFFNTLNQKGKELRGDYLITGSFFIEENNVVINCQIFDIERQEIIYVDETENKISAIMLEMIEELTENIKEELEEAKELREEERKRKEEERMVNISPFLGLYNFFSGLTFGVNYGSVKFIDNWSDEFANTEIITLNLSYYLGNINSIKNTVVLKNIGFIWKYEYFATRTEEFYLKRPLNIEFTGIAFNVSYLYKITNLFNLSLSGGGGIAEIELLLEPDYDDMGTLMAPGFFDKSKNPYYNITCSMDFFFKNLKLESGFSYYFVRHSPKDFRFAVFYFGLGYRI